MVLVGIFFKYCEYWCRSVSKLENTRNYFKWVKIQEEGVGWAPRIKTKQQNDINIHSMLFTFKMLSVVS